MDYGSSIIRSKRKDGGKIVINICIVYFYNAVKCFFSFLNENIVWNGQDRFAEAKLKFGGGNVYFEELAR